MRYYFWPSPEFLFMNKEDLSYKPDKMPNNLRLCVQNSSYIYFRRWFIRKPSCKQLWHIIDLVFCTEVWLSRKCKMMKLSAGIFSVSWQNFRCYLIRLWTIKLCLFDDLEGCRTHKLYRKAYRVLLLNIINLYHLNWNPLYYFNISRWIFSCLLKNVWTRATWFNCTSTITNTLRWLWCFTECRVLPNALFMGRCTMSAG